MLSEAAKAIWAKSGQNGSGGWLPLHVHSTDAAAVADRLWEWLPAIARATVARDLPGGDDDGRTLLRWLAAAHDIGKATPAFAIQDERLFAGCESVGLTAGLGSHRVAVRKDRALLPHGMASQHALRRRLLDLGFSGSVAEGYAVVVGGHHGVPPETVDVPNGSLRHLLGNGAWTQARQELLMFVEEISGACKRLPAWQSSRLSLQAQVVLSAAVILCDWIASNQELFPYKHPDSPDRAERAWRHLALPTPWCPVAPAGGAETHFADRFTLPPNSRLRPVQRVAMEAARSMPGPGLMLIEAPMGVGKTEAALAAVEVLAARFGSGGAIIALPTQATSNGVFPRMLQWLHRLPRTDGAQPWSVRLAHAKATLNDDFAGLLDVGAPTQIDKSERHDDAAVAHAWLSGRKKGVLSSFVVGTIDQVLFAGLRVRHLALRHLALLGKVVVIDEVHAADVFMSVFLHRVLEWMGYYGVPTIVMTATLPPEARTGLAQAYADGLAAACACAHVPEIAARSTYPSVMTVTHEGSFEHPCEPDGRTSEVTLRRLRDDDAALVALLRDRLASGGVAGVLRNTVRRAQDTATLLSSELPEVPVMLLHSRFLSVDRAEREAELRRLLGPPGPETCRPQRLVVVGTQVLEQSLDIDLDLLVSDLAPADLVLQRIGRLHRHARKDRPAGLTAAECHLTGVQDWSSVPITPVVGSSRIYGRASLLRSSAALGEYLDGRPVRLPADVPAIVDAAYAVEPCCPAGWREAILDADREASRAGAERERRAEVWLLRKPRGSGQSSLVDWLGNSVGDVDEDSAQGQAQVRDAEDGIEVCVVQRRSSGTLHVLPWIPRLGGTELPAQAAPPEELARVVATCTLRLPAYLVRGPGGANLLLSLDKAPPAWRDSHWLGRQPVLILDDDLEATLGDFRLRYDREQGLTAHRRELQ